MKRYLLLYLLICSCAQLSAQRLYLHDVYNGNFRSYDLGDEIEVMLFNATDIVKGKIVGFTSNGFYLNDTTHIIHLNEVASIVSTRKSGFARVVSGVAGGVLVFWGTIYVIGGVVLIWEEPTAGAGVVLIGAIMGTGGYLLIDKVANKKNAVKIKTIDQVNLRLFIE